MAGLSVVVLLAVAAGACADGEPTGDAAKSSAPPPSSTLPEAPTPKPLQWAPCPEVGEAVECATLEVPLDYAHPEGRTISLALSRVRATSEADRLGALVFNPGGPGVTGLSMPADLVAEEELAPADRDTLGRFDLIGFNPRGTEGSTPVDCGDTTAVDTADYSPESPEEIAQLKATMQAFAAACAEHSGELLRFVGSADAARDVEQIRRALGEEKLNLFGFSYGTELFGTYADLYPQRVRTAVLDGPVPSLESGLGFFADQARTLEVQFQAFLERCAARPDCPLATGGDPGATFDDLIATWDASPPTLPTGETFTASEAATVAANGTYAPAFERLVEAGLASGTAGDPSALKVGWDIYSDREGTEPSPANAAGVAINCADYTWPEPDEMFERAVTELQAEAPRMGEAFLREYLPCAYWSVPGAAPHTRTAKGSPPILVVGTTDDPATPFAGAEELVDQLDDAVLLVREGRGHTAWSDSACVRAAVDRYLLTGEPPETGTSCPSDP